MVTSTIPRSSQEYKHLKSLDALFARAASLWNEGYRCSAAWDGALRIVAASGACYLVDLERHSCECVSFSRGEYRAQSGRCWCKHLLGAVLLAEDQAQDLERQAAEMRRPITRSVHDLPLRKMDYWWLNLGNLGALTFADQVAWRRALLLDRKAEELRQIAEAERARRARRRAA